MNREGIIFVISAPSGAGKTTLCKEIIDFFPTLRHSVSYTTRLPRAGETDGVDYHFVSRERFDAMVAEGAFVEWAQVHGNCYGTALETLRSSRQAGADILLDIDCQGAAQLKKNLDNCVYIFIMPPSFEELRRRLENRGTDSAEVIATRIANARSEMRQASWYDYIVVNDRLELALAQVQSIVTAEGVRARLVLPTLGELLPGQQ